jgi:hypothetical protein
LDEEIIWSIDNQYLSRSLTPMTSRISWEQENIASVPPRAGDLDRTMCQFFYLDK